MIEKRSRTLFKCGTKQNTRMYQLYVERALTTFSLYRTLQIPNIPLQAQNKNKTKILITLLLLAHNLHLDTDVYKRQIRKFV